MSKILQVARREFASTALTKGFIIGALVLPAIFALVMPLLGFLIQNAKAPAEVGRVAIIDRSGEMGELLRERLAPEALAEAKQDRLEGLGKAATQGAEGLGEAGGDGEDAPQAGMMASTLDSILGEVPQFTIDLLAPDADVEQAQSRLREPVEDEQARTIALIEVDEDAVERAGGGFGSYTLYTRPKIDVRTSGTIERTVERAIKDVRYRIAGVDADELRALTTVERRGVQEVTETGTRESVQSLKMLLPFGVMILLFMGVLTGGQYLLTTTVEEKASRVVEVLLSAVSPMQLMFGKILGQLFVGLTLTLIYTSLGIIALLTFALADLLEWTDLVYMLIFFLIAYVMIASFMAAVGSAVNEMREAQSLMAPAMIVLIMGFYLSFPVSLSPSAPWAVAMSMIPPISPFAMLARIASTEPPPAWQVWVSIVISSLAAYGCVWLAAKVFRIGLLMYGKPPNFKTLIRWVRMA